MGTLRFFEEVVSFKIRRTFGFADYINFILYEKMVYMVLTDGGSVRRFRLLGRR